MSFTIPNEGDAFNANIAEPDSGDIDILVAAYNGTGIISGCAVTAQGTPDMTVAVASGVIVVNDGTPARQAVTGDNVTITAADGSNPRLDLIVSNAAGTLSAVAGTAAVDPVYPAIPANSVVLAAVYIPTSDTAIETNQITDKRVINAIPIAQLADGTDGALITWDSSGFPTIVTPGAVGTILRSGGAGAEFTWSTATYPATTTISQLLYSSSTNVIAGLTTGNNGVLITSGTGVPSISSTLPNATQDNITRAGTVTSGTWNSALNIVGDTTPQLGGALDGQGNDITSIGVLTLIEQAAAEANVAARGQIWVKTATPNQLWFSDDVGTDFQIANRSDTLAVFAATTSAALATIISDETGTGLLVFGTSPTIVTPTIASFANANHNHENSAGGGTIAEAAISDLGTYLVNIVEDTTPQLGGNLDGQGNDLIGLGTVSLIEQASANVDVAGSGQIWVKTATPNQLWFTDDAGGDKEVVYAGGAFHDGFSDFAANEHYTQASIVATGALNSGSITSGFGNINNGASTITTTGGGSLTGTWTNLGSVTTIDINGGTIDGVSIGATTKVLSIQVDESGITVDPTGDADADIITLGVTGAPKLFWDESQDQFSTNKGIDFTAGTITFDEVDDGNSSTADTINWTTGQKHKSTLTGNVTYTFTAPTGPCNLLLRIVQGASAYTVTWPATVKWPGATAPTISTGNGAIDIVAFYFDGTNYNGVVSQDFS